MGFLVGFEGGYGVGFEDGVPYPGIVCVAGVGEGAGGESAEAAGCAGYGYDFWGHDLGFGVGARNVLLFKS